jgi:comEA protein
VKVDHNKTEIIICIIENAVLWLSGSKEKHLNITVIYIINIARNDIMKNPNKALSVLLLSSAVLFTPLSSAFGGELSDSPSKSYNQADSQAFNQAKGEANPLPGFVPPIADPMQQTVNINLASYEQLISLPGIGRVKAAAIINYRKEAGGFKTLEDIQNIKGIGQKLFERLASKINI